MMQAFAARGHTVSLATVVQPSTRSLEGLPLASLHALDIESVGTLPLTGWQRRFANYYGVNDAHGIALAAVLKENAFDAVVMVSRHLLPLLSVVRGPVRVWYPADDPAWHHLTRISVSQPRTWGELKPAAVNILYERAFRACYDRVWVVSPSDRSAMRLFSGCRAVDLTPNGVDAHHYSPAGRASETDLPTTCVFWGRLDFDPNVDALEWFIGKIWPEVVKRTPTARFAVFGFNPRERVRELTKSPGVELHPDLPDLRHEVSRRAVVVLPFITGGGIKNKLLEAAALGMPIACTAWALSGTKGTPAVRVCRSARDWAGTLAGLWADATARRDLGDAARSWVTTHHTWNAAAATAEAGILRMHRSYQPSAISYTEKQLTANS